MTDTRLPSADELLSQAQWLRRLLDDALPSDAVDDALQETWTCALRGVPQAPGALRPWLRTVARRAASALRLGEGRRRAREQGSTPPTGPPAADEVVERLDWHERITAAVRDLPEPYRSTVLLRYYDDVTVRELARRFSTTVDNIYARLARARMMIRERLPEDSRAGVPLILLPTSAGANWLAVAGVVMSALVVAALCAFSDPSPDELRVAQVTSPVIGRTATNANLPAVAQVMGAELMRREVAHPSVGSDVTTPNVIGASRPSGLFVTVRPALPEGEMLLEQRDRTSSVRLDANGKAHFPDVDIGSGQLRLGIDPGLRFQRSCDIRAQGEALTWSLGTAVVVVHVYDLEGNPAQNAFVWLSESSGVSLRANTDSLGQVRLPFVAAGEHQLYASIERDDEKIFEEVRKITVAAGEQYRAEFGSPWGMPRWRGTLRAATGEPVLGATATGRSKLVLTHQDTGALVPHYVKPDGTFDIRLAPGKYRVLVFPHSSIRTHFPVAGLSVNTRELRHDVFLPGSRVVVRADVLNEPSVSTLHLNRKDKSGPGHSTTRRPDNTFVFDGVKAGEWQLSGNRLAEPRDLAVVATEPHIVIEVILR